MKFLYTAIFLLALAACHASKPHHQTQAMVYDASTGRSLGTVTFKDTKHGLLIIENLRGLTPGEHGMHVHEYPNCAATTDKNGKLVPAGAAGGHYDPHHTGKHLGPEKAGHRGDLPVLLVGSDGTAHAKHHVKGLKAKEFKNRSLVIHAGGDNYSDKPVALGGGGDRIACGVIK